MTSIQTRQQVPRPLAPVRAGLSQRPATTPSSLTGKDVARIFRRRKWLILGFLVGFGVAGAAAHVVWNRIAPLWSTAAWIEVNLPAQTVLSFSAAPNVDMLERYKQSLRQIARSPMVMDGALRQDAMKQTLWFQRWYQRDPSLARARRELLEEVQVASQADSLLLRVSLSGWTNVQREREELATIVNTIARTFVDMANKTANDKRMSELTAIKAEITRVSGLRDARQRALDDEFRGAKIPVMRNQADSLTLEIQDLVRRQTELSVQQSQLHAAKEGIDAQYRRGLLEVNPAVMETLERDPTLSRLESELRLVQATLDREEKLFAENHPQWQQHQAMLRSLQTRMDDRRTELTKKAVEALRVGFEQQLVTITDALVDISGRLDEAVEVQRDINNTLQKVDTLEKERRELEEELKRLVGRQTDLELVRQELPVRVVMEAGIPIEPAMPKLKFLLPLGIFLGLGLGIGLAFLLELMDSSVKTRTDVTRRIDLPLLATVPHADDVEEEIEDLRLACLSAPDSLISESFRRLRTNLLFSGPSEQHRSILVTSPSPDDGRSTVAVNLAMAMAGSGRRVLLIDANFRRPAVSALFPEAGQTGLSDVLSGQQPWTQCVHPTASVPNLSVMASGPLPPNPTELLGHELSAKMLEEMVQQYDQVVLDGPPLLISDASVLATQVDATILVVRAGVNTHGIVTRCREDLQRIGAHILGVVLNGVQTTAGGYLQKNYDAFYDYHEQPEA